MAPAPIRWCCQVLKWSPVIFIAAVIAWSYYAYVIAMCIFTVESIPEKVIYMLIYHPLLVMFAWSYWQTIFTPSGKVPSQFYLSPAEVERFDRETNEDTQKEILNNALRGLPVQCRTISGYPRYCEKCKCIKPDRCHHCSVCHQCVLKMDHHCPWVNNCVSFTNYKFFVMFLGYALIYCLYVAGTSLQYFIEFWTSGAHKEMTRFHILFLFFVSIMFGISLISLFCYHLYLATHNRSTLESFRAPVFRSGPDKNGFSLGNYNNFTEIFGENKLKWFLPITTNSGDGVSFPTRTTAPANSYQTMENTPSVGDGVTYPTRTVDNDSDTLLGARQRWMEEGEPEQSGGAILLTRSNTNLLDET